MPTSPYYIKSGARVPGTTTIISGVSLGSIEGLLQWANKLGLEGKNHRDERQKAADAGTACHEMAECYATGKEFDREKYPQAVIEKALRPYEGFLEWAQQTQFKIAKSEVALVSEKHRYGGTLDCMLVNGKLALGDYKTSNSIRVGMLLQLAAYRNLWEENHEDQPITGGFHLLKFSKPEHPDDPVSFSHHYWESLTLAWDAFVHCRALYDINKRLQSYVK